MGQVGQVHHLIQVHHCGWFPLLDQEVLGTSVSLWSGHATFHSYFTTPTLLVPRLPSSLDHLAHPCGQSLHQCHCVLEDLGGRAHLACVCVHVCVCMLVCGTCMCVCACVCACVCVCMHMHVCTCVCVCVRVTPLAETILETNDVMHDGQLIGCVYCLIHCTGLSSNATAMMEPTTVILYNSTLEGESDSDESSSAPHSSSGVNKLMQLCMIFLEIGRIHSVNEFEWIE